MSTKRDPSQRVRKVKRPLDADETVEETAREQLHHQSTSTQSIPTNGNGTSSFHHHSDEPDQMTEDDMNEDEEEDEEEDEPAPPPPKKKPRKGAEAAATGSGGGRPSALLPHKDQNKGLRHFSVLVCEKLASLGTSTYKEIADQLVQESNSQKHYSGYDEKNIRRRIYDALNVLMAMEIIQKERKNIKWKGFDGSMTGGGKMNGNSEAASAAAAAPKQSASETAAMNKQILSYKKQIAAKRQELPQKRAHLEELALQFCGMRALLQRNHTLKPSSTTDPPPDRIVWPFLVLAAPPGIPVECTTDEPREIAILKFDEPFVIHEHTSVLKYYGEHIIQQTPVPTLEAATQALLDRNKITSAAITAAAANEVTKTLSAPVPSTPVPAVSKSDSPFDTLVSAAAASPKLKPIGGHSSSRELVHPIVGSLNIDPRASLPEKLWNLLPDDSLLKLSGPSYLSAHQIVSHRPAPITASSATDSSTPPSAAVSSLFSHLFSPAASQPAPLLASASNTG